jgi:hypothetical protein
MLIKLLPVYYVHSLQVQGDPIHLCCACLLGEATVKKIKVLGIMEFLKQFDVCRKTDMISLYQYSIIFLMDTELTL